jgi:uncharacterized protein (TIGR03435 family)
MQSRVLRGKPFWLVAVVAAGATILFGQGQSQPGAAASEAGAAAPQSFEVASIKPSAEDGRRVMIGISPGGRYTASAVNVKFLIQQAYDIRDYQIQGGPGWITSARYDIVAKAETPNLDRERLKPLLKSLLAERFNLQVHLETRELPTYTLVVGKNGPKLQKSEVQTDAPEAGPSPKAAQPGAPGRATDDVERGGPRGRGATIRVGRGQVNAQMISLSDFAGMLAQQLGRPVKDKTGIEGRFDIKLEWTPDESQRGIGLPGDGAPRESGPAGDPSGPSIFTALQEQLGLKLESDKGRVEIIVIDRIDKPSAN